MRRERPAVSHTPSAWAMLGATCAGSRTSANETKTTPSEKRSATARPTARASLVLPLPPGPVSTGRGQRTQETSAVIITKPIAADPDFGGIGGDRFGDALVPVLARVEGEA